MKVLLFNFFPIRSHTPTFVFYAGYFIVTVIQIIMILLSELTPLIHFIYKVKSNLSVVLSFANSNSFELIC